MVLPPAVIVHGKGDAKAVLALLRPVTLLSAPWAASYGGSLWWQTLMAEVGVKGISLLDCGDAPGRAVAALRLGLNGIVLTCEPEIYGVVAGLAEETGSLLLPKAPPALDMAERDAKRRLAGWLGGDSAAPMR